MNNSITDRDCINLSELTYQDIKALKDKDVLSKSLFDGKNINSNIISTLKEDYKKNLTTFPDYYIPTFEKYRLIDIGDQNSQSGYYGAAFLNIYTNDIIIANKGTKFDSLGQVKRDIVEADSGFVLGKIREQYIDGIKFYNDVKDYTEDPTHQIRLNNIYLTGHSLGGGIAALQYLYFYKSDKFLKEIRTFEAPGVGLIVDNLNSPGTKFLGKNFAMYMDSKSAQEIKDKTNNSSKDREYQYRKKIQENYSVISSYDKEQMIEYGTTLDWIYNGLPHVGNTRNPLSRDRRYIHADNLGYIAERGPIPPVEVYHSINTYKIYALDKDDDNIICGQIELNNFFKLIMPSIVTFTDEGDEIISFLDKMYTDGFASSGAVYDFLMRNYSVSGRSNEIKADVYNKNKVKIDRILNNREVTDVLYKYSVVFGFLKDSISKQTFLDSAKSFISKNCPDVNLDSEEKLSHQELFFRIADFEILYGIENVEKASMREILAKSCAFIDKKSLAVYEHLINERAYSFFYDSGVKERMLCMSAAGEYKEFCKTTRDINSRVIKMGDLIFYMKSSFDGGMYDF